MPDNFSPYLSDTNTRPSDNNSLFSASPRRVATQTAPRLLQRFQPETQNGAAARRQRAYSTGFYGFVRYSESSTHHRLQVLQRLSNAYLRQPENGKSVFAIIVLRNTTRLQTRAFVSGCLCGRLIWLWRLCSQSARLGCERVWRLRGLSCRVRRALFAPTHQ